MVMALSACRAFSELRLQLRRIEEDETRELDRARRHVDEALETVRDQMGDEPTVVQVRVRQEKRVDLLRVVRERESVAHGLVRTSLEHPAIDEDLRVTHVEEVLRAGDGRRATQEGKVHARLFWPLPCSARCSEARRSRSGPRVKTMRSISFAGSPTWRSRGFSGDAWRSRSSRSWSS